MRSSRLLLAVGAVLGVSIGCSAAKNDNSGASGTGATANNGASGAPASGSGGGGATTSGNSGTSGSNGGKQPTGSAGDQGTAPNANMDGGTPPSTMPPAAAIEMLDSSIDWTALKLVYAPMYSAYDGEHTFQVPVHVDGATVDLSGWQAIPSDAVSFDPDPDSGGVLVTILKGEPEITIAASNGTIGGTALLRVTVGTPDDWMKGQARYSNGVEFDFPDIDFAQAVLDPNWMPPPPPPNLACNNCHSLGAKYFEIQHTPTQAARFSDQDLITIFTTGMKPPGVGFRVLPDMLGDMTAAEVYAGFHKWDSTPAEQKGLIIYLRSLTPMGQGDILLPDGTYVAPGTIPDGGIGGSQ